VVAVVPLVEREVVEAAPTFVAIAAPALVAGVGVALPVDVLELRLKMLDRCKPLSRLLGAPVFWPYELLVLRAPPLPTRLLALMSLVCPNDMLAAVSMEATAIALIIRYMYPSIARYSAVEILVFSGRPERTSLLLLRLLVLSFQHLFFRAFTALALLPADFLDALLLGTLRAAL
jgi:hypothetical protein